MLHVNHMNSSGYGVYGDDENNVAWVCNSPDHNCHVLRVNWAGKRYTGQFISKKTVSFVEHLPDDAMDAAIMVAEMYYREQESQRNEIHGGIA